MGTPSAAAIAVSISARVAMLLASSSGSSSLRARLVQSRAARCASDVIIEGFPALSSTLLALGSSQGHQGINELRATHSPLVVGSRQRVARLICAQAHSPIRSAASSQNRLPSRENLIQFVQREGVRHRDDADDHRTHVAKNSSKNQSLEGGACAHSFKLTYPLPARPPGCCCSPVLAGYETRARLSGFCWAPH